ncbi:MAG: hypothetical protein NVS1B11_38040 [Terriglobales bacterium]
MRAEEVRRVTPDMLEPTPGEPVPAILRLPSWATKEKMERVIPLGTLAHAIMTWDPELSPNYKKAYEAASVRVRAKTNIHLRALRHTFASTADQSGDQRCVDIIMGHGVKTVQRRYQTADMARLARVAIHVERWLLGTLYPQLENHSSEVINVEPPST